MDTTVSAPQEPVVVVVDDSEIDRYILGRQLELVTEEIRVLEFSGGEAALDYVKSNIGQLANFPRLFLVDINMPLMDGFEFIDALDQLPEIGGNIPQPDIFLVSSSQSESDQKRMTAFACIKGFIPKPPSIEDVTAVLSGLSC
jgi:CheY-like chemotaxis protein